MGNTNNLAVQSSGTSAVNLADESRMDEANVTASGTSQVRGFICLSRLVATASVCAAIYGRHANSCHVRERSSGCANIHLVPC